MAPRKRRAPEAPQPSGAAMPVRVTRSMARSSERVTRSAAKRAGASESVGAESERKSKSKKAKRGGKGKQQQQQKKKKQEEGESQNQGHEGEGASSSNANKTIVIEHSTTQGNYFNTRAAEVKKNLEERLHGITVIVNPQKPRKGCFEIRAEGGEKFISLLRMKRPFKRLKDLDIAKVVSDITDKIN